MNELVDSLSSKIHFDHVSRIGRGSFGEVYLIKIRTELRVVKRVDLTHCQTEDKASAVEEALILSRLSHPNVLSISDFFIEGNHFYMIMDYADCGDLRQLIKNRQQTKNRLSEVEVKYILYQCCLGLEYIHDRNIIHRDIKSDNIFMHNNRTVIKLGDFGIAKVLHSTQSLAQTLVGTPYYFSPELCENEPYGKMTDIWSLGCVCYELLELDLPFKAKSLPQLLQIIRSKEPRPVTKMYSKSLRMLVKSMLHKVHSKRPTINQILNDNRLNWPLSGITKRNMFCDTQDDQQDQEGKGSLKNDISTQVYIDRSPRYEIQECNQSSWKDNTKCNIHRSWKIAMQNAENNANHNINVDCERHQEDASSLNIINCDPSKLDKKIAGRCDEGINTLVRRLEIMNVEFSGLNK